MATSRQRNEIELPKRKYASPKLTQYGSVRTLTQAGTSGTSENKACGSGQGPPSKKCV